MLPTMNPGGTSRRWGSLQTESADMLDVAFLSQDDTKPAFFWEAIPDAERVIDQVRRFANPVVVDIGEGSKTLMLTLEQLGADGEVLERRRVMLSYSEDDRFRDDMHVMERYEDRIAP